MKRYLLFTLLLAGLLALAACSGSETESAPITVENVRANMTLPSDTGSFWMLITNNSDTDDALMSAKVDGCGVIELHDMIMENDVMVMRPVAGGQIPIPAGQTVELKPGGLHVMCMQKAAPLELGTKVQVELEFANAGTITVEGEVVEPAVNHGMNNN
ncbi:MAG TPA: copper chaperone PCu(A)C [Chloroflexota bacterium]|nr:copper chaperone PCu(A)C [Chloroflexota bacterium]HUM71739.1 copper chaperone PCu(A)C [Chloroflexota bacterium]